MRCIRDGNHDFKSIDVAKKVGEIILEKTDWKVDLTLMDIEVVALLSDDALHVSTLENIGPVHTALHYLEIFLCCTISSCSCMVVAT